ncbi:MAG: hypothetical protein DWQ05_12290 [Calditrichaeota bacterium]|nr:MAG: hypothetical protein DWQ05_12290 [Calditrichota bacterium]
MLKFNIFKLTSLVLLLSTSACVLNNDDDKNQIRIETGTSFGECIGYCSTTMEIAGTSVVYKSYSWNATEFPERKLEFELDDAEYDGLNSVLNLTDISTLDAVIGCPDCADGGAEWISIEQSGKTKKVSFEYGAEIPEISAIMAILRSLRSKADTLVNNPRTIISSKQPQELIRDEYKIVESEIIGNKLHLTVEYSGGCARHYFDLYMAPNSFLESWPVQAVIFLQHNGSGDACKALKRKSLVFDLSPIAELYQSYYNGQLDPILLNLSDYSAGKFMPVVQIRFVPEN